MKHTWVERADPAVAGVPGRWTRSAALLGLAVSFGVLQVTVGKGSAQEEVPPLATVRVSVRPLKPPPAGTDVVEYFPGEPILVEWSFTNEGPGAGMFLGLEYGGPVQWALTCVDDGTSWGGGPPGWGQSEIPQDMARNKGYREWAPGAKLAGIVDLTLCFGYPMSEGEFEARLSYRPPHPLVPAPPGVGVSAAHEDPPFRFRIAEPTEPESWWRIPYMALEVAKHWTREGSPVHNYEDLLVLLHRDVGGPRTYLREWAEYYEALVKEGGLRLAEGGRPKKEEALWAWQIYLRHYPDSPCAPAVRQRIETLEQEIAE